MRDNNRWIVADIEKLLYDVECAIGWDGLISEPRIKELIKDWYDNSRDLTVRDI